MTQHNTAAKHVHPDCPACREEHYERAKADPVAAVVLDALHAQDAATYNGSSSDMGQVALDAAAKIREALTRAAPERARMLADIDAADEDD